MLFWFSQRWAALDFCQSFGWILDGNVVTSIVQIACRIALRDVGRSENLGSEQIVQVNLCQKHSLLNQLTHNMTTDCSLIYETNTSSEHVVDKKKFECKKKNVKTILGHIMIELVCFSYRSCKSMNNLLSYWGLTDVKLSTPEKDLPVISVKIISKIYR